jgi:hypothetical protein
MHACIIALALTLCAALLALRACRRSAARRLAGTAPPRRRPRGCVRACVCMLSRPFVCTSLALCASRRSNTARTFIHNAPLRPPAHTGASGGGQRHRQPSDRAARLMDDADDVCCGDFVVLAVAMRVFAGVPRARLLVAVGTRVRWMASMRGRMRREGVGVGTCGWRASRGLCLGAAGARGWRRAAPPRWLPLAGCLCVCRVHLTPATAPPRHTRAPRRVSRGRRGRRRRLIKRRGRDPTDRPDRAPFRRRLAPSAIWKIEPVHLSRHRALRPASAVHCARCGSACAPTRRCGSCAHLARRCVCAPAAASPPPDASGACVALTAHAGRHGRRWLHALRRLADLRARLRRRAAERAGGLRRRRRVPRSHRRPRCCPRGAAPRGAAARAGAAGA